VVLLDAAYGNNSDLRADITALELTYVVGILSNTTVWAPESGPLPAKKWSGRGRPPKLLRRDAEHQPVSVKKLALGLPKRAWRTISWREGTAESLSSRFARVRVRAARRDFKRSESRPEEWLLIEWPMGENEPTKYWLSTLPEDISLHRLVYFAKLRWRIERDYQELKQEVGLGHFEGRGCVAFTITPPPCITAYAFLISERETIPPSSISPISQPTFTTFGQIRTTTPCTTRTTMRRARRWPMRYCRIARTGFSIAASAIAAARASPASGRAWSRMCVPAPISRTNGTATPRRR
jgi:hypothetical protein